MLFPARRRGVLVGLSRSAALFEELCEQSRPPCLMARPETFSGVSVKELKKLRIATEIRFFLEQAATPVYGPPAVRVRQKQRAKPVRELSSGLLQGKHLARPGGKFDAKCLPVIVMKPLKGFDQKKIHWKPDRPAPIGVSAKQSGL